MSWFYYTKLGIQVDLNVLAILTLMTRLFLRSDSNVSQSLAWNEIFVLKTNVSKKALEEFHKIQFIHANIIREKVMNGYDSQSKRHVEFAGISLWSDKHGGKGFLNTGMVKLEYSNEFVVPFHGHYARINK